MSDLQHSALGGFRRVAGPPGSKSLKAGVRCLADDEKITFERAWSRQERHLGWTLTPLVTMGPSCMGHACWSSRLSGAAGELASLGVDPDLFAFFDEGGNAKLKTCLQPGQLGDGAGGGVAADRGFGVGDGELHLDGQLQTNRIAVVLVDLEEGAFEEEFEGVSHHVAAEGEGFEAALVEEVGAVGVAVEVGCLNGLQVGLLELVTGLECLVEDGAGEQVTHLEADQGLAAASGGRGDLDVQAAEGGVFEFEEHFALYFDGVDQSSHGFLRGGVGERFRERYRGPSPECRGIAGPGRMN